MATSAQSSPLNTDVNYLTAIIDLIPKALPHALNLEIAVNSVIFRHDSNRELFVQKYYIPDLGDGLFIQSLMDEAQCVCADMLSEYWPKLGKCYLDYRVDEKDSDIKTVFVST